MLCLSKFLPKLTVPYWNAAHNRSAVFRSSFQHVAFASTRPTRPANSFFLYMQERQPSKPKNVSQTDFLKLQSKHWKELSEDAKKPYLVKSEQMMEEYNQKVKDFRLNATDEELDALTDNMRQQRAEKQKRRKRKDEKEFYKPKKPLNGYQYFVRTQKQCYIIKTQKDAHNSLSSIAREWRDMSVSLRNRYNTRVEEDKKRYEREMDDYVKRLIAAKREDLIPARLLKTKNEE